jgi:hypothetical protein
MVCEPTVFDPSRSNSRCHWPCTIIISAYELNRIRNLTKGKVIQKSACVLVGGYYIRYKGFFLKTLGLGVLLLGAAAYAWLYP